uniref:Protein SAAL1 n=1 Tax=Geotrypetes seraphini TaxID=260995 RepID=A0A6P8PS00_GEOSA|nr:protein SAAL1 [Geotrypetes seraphini]XP_033784700.1 protein SAAL1 [Geotrypetes seraphini]XP_033784702.1 protein SAAL1 [Geotrypetes seraphini]XP_033784703.1 protein SAAL1 [Geotrypetes seraphini]
MDRNPSPPTSDDEEEGPVGDAIGDTVYSKHWVFSTLTKLIEVITSVEDGEMLTDLNEEMENEICKIWDISVDEDVALFLQDFSTPETFLRVISNSRCPRLTEICVGILANMACFQEPCVSISNNEDLGELLLLLLCDSDPPTLLETSRLLLTCLSRLEVASIWVERIRKHPSVHNGVCFIMMSSTNVELLVKVGEAVDKLFDLDEDLMLGWIEGGGQELDGQLSSDGEDEKTSALELVPCILEAAKQVRADNPEGLEVYMHILQLLTTVDKGIQAIVHSSEAGEETWDLLSDLICHEFCQADDPPIIVQEQKTVLASVLSVLSAMFSSQAELGYMKIEKNSPLIGSLIQVLQHLEDCRKKPTENSERSDTEKSNRPMICEEDLHLKILQDVCCEFLSNILLEMNKETTLQGLKHGHLNEQKCLCAFRNLLPLYSTTVKSFVEVLHDADQMLAEKLEKSFPALKDNT